MALARLRAGKISGPARDESIKLVVNCGEFSYAEVPKKYLRIVGVTGTLKTLTAPQQKLLKDEYGVDKKTFVPSVFGKNVLSFNSNDSTINGVRISDHDGCVHVRARVCVCVCACACVCVC
jgi:hypothetical protein